MLAGFSDLARSACSVNNVNLDVRQRAQCVRHALVACAILVGAWAPDAAQALPQQAPQPAGSPAGTSEVSLFGVGTADFAVLEERIALGSPRRTVIAAAFDAYQTSLAAIRTQLDAELEETAGHIRAMTPEERRDAAHAAAMVEAAESIVQVIERAEGRAKAAFATFEAAVLLDVSDAEKQSWTTELRRLRREKCLNSSSGSPNGGRDIERHVDLSALVALERNEGGSLASALRAAHDMRPDAPEALRALPARIAGAVSTYEQALDEELATSCWRLASGSARRRVQRMLGESPRRPLSLKSEVQHWERIERCTCNGRDAIATALGEAGLEEAAGAWNRAYDERAFPQLFAPKRVDLACRWIRSHQLPPNVMQEVDRVYLCYQDGLAPQIEQMKRAMILAVTRDGVPPSIVGLQRHLGWFTPVEQQLRVARTLSQLAMEQLGAALDDGLAKEFHAADRESFGRASAEIPIEY